MVCSESKASVMVSHTSDVTMKQNLTKLFLVLWASICHGVQLGTKWSALYSAQNGWLVTNCVKVHQTASTYWVSDTQKCNLHWNSLVITVFFLCEDTMDISTMHHCMQESSDGQKFWPQWLATVCQNNTKFEEAKVDQLIKEH
jgi:hypothetical protein